MGTGQFCTNPGLVVLVESAESKQFIEAIAGKYNSAPVTPLLGEGVLQHLSKAVTTLQGAGAKLLAGGQEGGGTGYCFRNTLLSVTGDQFLAKPEALQTEAFGNCSLFVTVRDAAQLSKIVEHFEGNLTGALYTATDGRDDELYDQVAPALRKKVGRLLNDKMPTGVAVSAAMNHGGPFPATGHPGFTAVGIPAAIHRFAMLECYDGIRPHRLPPALQDKNPTGKLWRFVNGTWSQADVA
jgi:NADP-dependent aldehyde dehydrogenase